MDNSTVCAFRGRTIEIAIHDDVWISRAVECKEPLASHLTEPDAGSSSGSLHRPRPANGDEVHDSVDHDSATIADDDVARSREEHEEEDDNQPGGHDDERSSNRKAGPQAKYEYHIGDEIIQTDQCMMWRSEPQPGGMIQLVLIFILKELIRADRATNHPGDWKAPRCR